ncbi:hypothetical protein V8C86DRAFT_2636239 [Haematococcus lacustris]
MQRAGQCRAPRCRTWATSTAPCTTAQWWAGWSSWSPSTTTFPSMQARLSTAGPWWSCCRWIAAPPPGWWCSSMRPYRNFVDELSPLTNKTYCEMLKDGAGKPSDTAPGASSWGPDYQRAAHPPGCPTTSWQPAHGIAGGPPLVLQKPRSSSRAIISSSSSDSSSNSSSEEVLGFCQSSQPNWSAYRDPSFGHAILNILGPNTAELAWYRNIDSSGQPADTARLERLSSCMDGAGRHEALARLKQLGH